MSDLKYMKRAIELAALGGSAVRPNPLVGAVVVKDGQVIAEGYHARYGAPHAEREALAKAGDSAEGATMYVTLEPCSHHGKTPPCTDAIIETGIKEVVVGMRDPNPHVQGNGIQKLQEAGIKCTIGILEDICKVQNEVFLVNVLENRPFVQLKIAQTLDGFIAPEDGNSKWITGEEARTEAHRLRAATDAIVIGRGTLIQDNPALTVRHVEGRQPKRVLLTDNLDLPISSQLFTDEFTRDTFVLYTDTPGSNAETVTLLEDTGIKTVKIQPDENGMADINHVLDTLFHLDIFKVMIEGGAGLYSSFLQAGKVDRIDAFVAPTIFGNGIGVFQGIDALTVANANTFKLSDLKTSGNDIYAVLRRG